MIVYLSLLVALIGALLYLSDKLPAKWQELGKLSFLAGLFVFLWCTCQGGHLVSLLAPSGR